MNGRGMKGWGMGMKGIMRMIRRKGTIGGKT